MSTVDRRPAGTKPLDRLPPLCTTGVGSLPFDDPTVAVRHATRAYGLPFCPQLPRHDGDMVREWLGADPGRCGWTAGRDRERPAAWEAFVDAMTSGGAPDHRLVKLQVTGPVTLAVALERDAGRPGHGREVGTLAREISVWLATNVAGQVARLTALGLDALVVVDEPGLAHAAIGTEAVRVSGSTGSEGRTTAGPGSEGETAPVRPAVAAAPAGVDAQIWDPLRTVGAAWGLHVCSQVPWSLVRDAEPDVVSFDATRYTVGGVGAAALAALIGGGTRIAWGALDAVQPDDPADVAARIAAGSAALVAAGATAADVVARSLVTPACGTGRLAPERERLVASVLQVGAELAAATWRAWPVAAPD